MTRGERCMVAAIAQKWPEITPEELLRWIYRLHASFDGLSPASYEDKYGNKRWRKALAGLKNL